MTGRPGFKAQSGLLKSQANERWRPMAISNPSTRLRAARSMPQWVITKQVRYEYISVQSPLNNLFVSLATISSLGIYRVQQSEALYSPSTWRF
uniref:Uncharacterized protein n=1 Tax=Timema genevievae TaxID=629358 RepID=A0A7R9PRV7_TIMGE|nr:unnamed protein product [Timema genevievae]